MLRIRQAIPLDGYRLRLNLSDGSTLERDVGPLLRGPVFDAIRHNPGLFRQVCVRHGTLWWPGDIDLCADVILGSMQPDA